MNKGGYRVWKRGLHQGSIGIWSRGSGGHSPQKLKVFHNYVRTKNFDVEWFYAQKSKSCCFLSGLYIDQGISDSQLYYMSLKNGIHKTICISFTKYF